jgi:stage II sporulation protein D
VACWISQSLDGRQYPGGLGQNATSFFCVNAAILKRVMHGRFAKLLLAGTLSPSLWAMTKVSVRGVAFNYPLDIRVRVLEFSPQQQFDLKIGRQNFSCAFQRYFPFSLPKGMELAAQTDEWACETAKAVKTLTLNEGLFLRASDEIVEIGARKFTGKIRFAGIGERLIVTNEVDLDRYLAGVVNREMGSHYPEEAMKAQIIAARSYALASLADRKKASPKRAFLYSTEFDQVYEGVGFESAKSRRLVKETLGQVLFQDESVLKAYYHASSGGSLETPNNVWDNRVHKVEAAAYEVKNSPAEIESGDARWSIMLSPLMGFRWENLGRIRDIRVLERSSSQRVKKIWIKGELSEIVVNGSDFRKKLGNRWLKSTLFDIVKEKKSWRIEGRGFGHGVGMSQMGARRMAEKGARAEEILGFYYPKANIKDLRLN